MSRLITSLEIANLIQDMINYFYDNNTTIDYIDHLGNNATITLVKPDIGLFYDESILNQIVVANCDLITNNELLLEFTSDIIIYKDNTDNYLESKIEFEKLYEYFNKRGSYNFVNVLSIFIDDIRSQSSLNFYKSDENINKNWGWFAINVKIRNYKVLTKT